MSSLLASMNPWIEDVCFHALTQNNGRTTITKSTPSQQRARLVQVRATRLSTHPSILVIHDGKTSIVAFCRTKPSIQPTRGCIVLISNWNVSLVQHCCPHRRFFEEQESHWNDIVSTFLNPNPRICLDVGTVQVLGGHGMGTVGNPTSIVSSVEIRRACMNLQSRGISLEQQLQIISTRKLGNVRTLFQENRDWIETLLAVPKHGIHGGGTTETTTNGTKGVVLGDVSSLLESLRKDDSNFVARMMMNPQSTTKRAHTDHISAATTKQASTSNRNQQGAPVLGNVREALTTTAGNDDMANALFAAAASHSSARRQSQDLTTSLANVVVEPYGIRERFESRPSVVSLSGISSVLLSLVAGRSSCSLEPENGGGEEAKQVTDTSTNNKVTQNETETRENDSDDDEDDSHMLGISDMLISQTQDNVAAEHEIIDCEKVQAEISTNATGENVVAGSRVQHQVEADVATFHHVGDGENIVAGSRVDYVETVVMDNSSDIPLDQDNNTNDAMEAESTTTLQHNKVMEEQSIVAGSNVFGVETADSNETVDNKTAVETRMIPETSNIKQSILEQSALETKVSKKRPLKNDDEETVEETIINNDEIQDATLTETQPPLQASNDNDNRDNGDSDEDNGIRAQDDTNVARSASVVPNRALVSTNSKRPKKKRRKGMLNLWKEQRARRKEKKQTIR